MHNNISACQRQLTDAAVDRQIGRKSSELNYTVRHQDTGSIFAALIRRYVVYASEPIVEDSVKAHIHTYIHTHRLTTI